MITGTQPARSTSLNTAWPSRAPRRTMQKVASCRTQARDYKPVLLVHLLWSQQTMKFSQGLEPSNTENAQRWQLTRVRLKSWSGCNALDFHSWVSLQCLRCLDPENVHNPTPGLPLETQQRDFPRTGFFQPWGAKYIYRDFPVLRVLTSACLVLELFGLGISGSWEDPLHRKHQISFHLSTPHSIQQCASHTEDIHLMNAMPLKTH